MAAFSKKQKCRRNELVGFGNWTKKKQLQEKCYYNKSSM